MYHFLFKYFFLLMLCSCWLPFLGCTPKINRPNANFNLPNALAIAGINPRYIFVANGNSAELSVIQTQEEDIDAIDLKPSAARYFPLSIPTPGFPKRLFTSQDGAWLGVWDSVASRVLWLDGSSLSWLKDPQDRALVSPDLTSLAQEVNPSIGQSLLVSDVQQAPWSCRTEADAACVVHFLVLVAKPSALWEVDVLKDSTGHLSTSVLFRQTPLPFVPSKMALHPQQAVVFISEAAAGKIYRLDLRSTTAQQALSIPNALQVPGEIDLLEVAAAGELLAVTRPLWQDIVFIGDAKGQSLVDGSLVILNADSPRQPPLTCLNDCFNSDTSASTLACSNQTPQEITYCYNVNQGINLTSQGPYPGLYVGAMPQQLKTLDMAAPISFSCQSSQILAMQLLDERRASEEIIEEQKDNDESLAASTSRKGQTVNANAWRFQHVLAVGLLRGQTLLVGLEQDPQSLLYRSTLLDRHLCEAPLLQSDVRRASALPLLTSCVTHPQEDSSWSCLTDSTQTHGVVLHRGQLSDVSWELEWEGALPHLDRSTAGGIIDPLTGRLSDIDELQIVLPRDPYPFFLGETSSAERKYTIGHRFTEDPYIGVQVGDIVEILSPHSSSIHCAENQLAKRPCEQRRITAIESGPGNLDPCWLVLDRPIDANCYIFHHSLAYRIRLANSFLLSDPENQITRRLSWSELYRHSTGGSNYAALWQLRTLTTADTSLSACEIYDRAGKVLPSSGQDPLLARRVVYQFRVRDYFKPFYLGLAPGSEDAALGLFPNAMLLWQKPADIAGPWLQTSLITSFAGSNSVLLWPLLETTSLSRDAHYRLLQ